MLERHVTFAKILDISLCTLIFFVASNPSSWFSNSNIVRCTSLSPAHKRDIKDTIMVKLNTRHSCKADLIHWTQFLMFQLNQFHP